MGACILAAFCSGSETAFSAAGRIQVAARGKKGARALWFMKRPSRYLATTLVGTNVGVVLTSSISNSWAVQMGDLWQVVFAFATAFFLLVFSEITPKHLALFRSNTISVAAAPFLFVFRTVMYPLIAAASGISSLIAGVDSTGRFFESREEVRGLLCSSGGRKGRLASSVLNMAEASVIAYSRPLKDFPGVYAGVGKEEAVELLLGSAENLLLVWEGAGATLAGAVKSSTLVRWNDEGSITKISAGLPYFDGETKPLKVLSRIWKSENAAAVLLDENGQPVNLVTAEMILTHLVPEQEDE
jgi:Mg2+/Co2+ transporter CorB